MPRAEPYPLPLPEGPAAGVELASLIYVSAATHMLTRAQIAHLLERARTRNAEHGVTGVLLYADGNFMQYLEGPPAGLDAVWRVIAADPQHHGIIELLREPVAERQFVDWRMAFRATRRCLEPSEVDATLSARLESAGNSSARWMLSKFWNRGAGPVSD